jgi:hypothetical protein
MVDGKCVFDQSLASVTVVGGSVNITQGDEEELKGHLYHFGPVSVAF